MRPLLTALSLGALTLHTAVAFGQSACDDDLIRQANDARRAGLDAEALPMLQRAWVTCHTPRSLAQTGLTEAALGRWLDAARDLSAALASREDPWIARNLPRLTEALAEVDTHLGRVLVRGPAGATAQVGAERIALPQQELLRVAVGSVRVEVRAPGRSPVVRDVVVAAGQSIVEDVVLAPVVQAVSEAPARAPVAEAPNPAVDRPAPPGRVQRVFAWTSLSLGVLAVGGATTALVLREGEVAAFNADARCGVNGGNVLGGGGCAARRDAAGDLEALAIAGYALGGALAVTAIVLFATAPSRATPPRALAHVACTPSLAAPGVTCAATF